MKHLIMKCGLFIILSFSQWAWGDSVQDLSNQLIPLRSQMESQALQMDVTAQSFEQTRLSLQSQILELKQNLNRERLKTKVLMEKTKQVKGFVNSGFKGTKQDQAFVRLWIQDLKKWVDESLPFQLLTRQAELEQLQSRLDKNEPLEPLLWELWNFTSAELKNTKGFSNQITEIKLDQGSVKAEVARLGMVHMFFKTSDQKLGYSQKTAAGWQWKQADPKEVSAIEQVIKASRTQSFRNVFELPGFDYKGSVQ